ncbi:methyltransferase domain-containing protein [Ornithinimicrobium panacihumi]|uniref:methyltransferase domain-containing protein n=1 Tax=Ornithinimicrobium panacihumi TaxID=2008449 RepID=UPI003F8ACE67
MPAAARAHRSEKVVCYIVRDDHLLVFTHRDYPMEQTGVQVPAGTLDPGEDAVAGALREAIEESGLTGLRVVALLGEDEYDIAPVRDEVLHRRFFLLEVDEVAGDENAGGLEVAGGELEPRLDLTARWEHRDPDPSGGGEAPRWECFWMPLEWGHVLSCGQGRFVGVAADLVTERKGRPDGGRAGPVAAAAPPPAGHHVRTVPVEPEPGRRPTTFWPGLEDPDHSHAYVQRFRVMPARGEDLEGESRLVDVLAPRHAHLLDAGCGPGRHGGHLARLGHRVVGVDLDPVLIDAAGQDPPGATWLVGDLVELDLPSQGITEPFDGVLLAGNVMDFLTPEVRGEALRRIAGHLAADGFVVVGCRVTRGFTPAELDALLPEVGLTLEQRFATWDLRPWETTSGFAVSVLRKGS